MIFSLYQDCCHWSIPRWFFIMMFTSHASKEWPWCSQHYFVCFISLVILIGQEYIWKLRASLKYLIDQSSKGLSLSEMQVWLYFQFYLQFQMCSVSDHLAGAMHCVLVAAIIAKALKCKKKNGTRSIFNQLESIFHQILGIPRH